jgi:transposase InsO family protein
MSLQGSLSIERMCELVRVSRASFYRSFQEQQPVEEEMEIRSAIQQIAIEHRRRYGYRRISAELRRRGMQLNHKRVMRIMAEDNLLAVQRKSFVVSTHSDHEFEVYLNLAGRMKVTGINQLWVADILPVLAVLEPMKTGLLLTALDLHQSCILPPAEQHRLFFGTVHSFSTLAANGHVRGLRKQVQLGLVLSSRSVRRANGRRPPPNDPR